ncbi:uncharacterized protein LOC108950562 [Ciona intestinalis]
MRFNAGIRNLLNTIVVAYIGILCRGASSQRFEVKQPRTTEITKAQFTGLSGFLNTIMSSDINLIDDPSPSNICPNQCLCLVMNDQSGYNVTCTKGAKMSSLELPSNMEYFSYTGGKFSQRIVRAKDFTLFTNLTYLDLSNNGIRRIETAAFNRLRNLRTLVLDDNYLADSDSSFLRHISTTLRYLSLRNIVAPNQPRQFRWSFLSGTSQSSIAQQTVTFTNLRTLRLDGNGITSISLDVLENANILQNLEVFSLSGNSLARQSLSAIVRISYIIKKRRTPESQGSTNLTTHVNQNLPKPEFTIDLSRNNISFLDVYDLNALTQSQLKAGVPLVRLKLAGNPINCICRIKGFMEFLFKENGTSVVADWKYLKCSKPRDLRGAKLHYLEEVKVHYCHGDWGNSSYIKLAPAQLAFVVVCSTTLCIVSMAVLYLNRSKCINYWSILKNCGEDDEDYRNKIRWRNKQFTNKYSIPLDHKGIGHSGYFSEEIAAYHSNGTIVRVGKHKSDDNL